MFAVPLAETPLGCLILLLHTPNRRSGFRGFCIMGSIAGFIE